ncbi:MAG: type II/IV secretion system protein [Phycisphaerales bacterium]|nr:type II/IV secretion system protein [Phycisphaerales bacterium]
MTASDSPNSLADQPSRGNGAEGASTKAPVFVDAIPREFARRHLILPDGRGDACERLLVAPSTDPAALFNAGVRLGIQVAAQIGDPEAIARGVDALYGAHRSAATTEAEPDGGTDGLPAREDLDRLLAAADRDLLNTQGKGRVVRLVDALLFEALGRSASDVHIQPLAEHTLVRYRIDGVLHDVRQLSHEVAVAVVSRVKVMGRMDIAERRIPQDGRATVSIGQRPIDLRISTVPTSYGERAVIRLLDNAQQLCDFDQLGMPAPVAAAFLERALRTNGIILVTGPTGSGKTTTLYSTLRRIGTSRVNIMTIEDPIEYELSTTGLAVSQAQVNTRKGITFATGLRHILRQDPDVVMVGEIRDLETARIAIQSSLTGHLVLSTLHTNDAPSAVTRLIDLGIEPYLVSASLSAVLAQRLVRTVHQACGGQGCDVCFGTGLRGRVGVFELLPMDDALRNLVSDGRPLSELREAAIRAGMTTLLAEGRRLAEGGITTDEEVQRVLLGAQ